MSDLVGNPEDRYSHKRLIMLVRDGRVCGVGTRMKLSSFQLFGTQTLGTQKSRKSRDSVST